MQAVPRLQHARRHSHCGWLFAPRYRQNHRVCQHATSPRIHFIAGGFHLVVASDPDIEKIVTALHDRFKVEYVAPGHCTGEPAFTALKKAFGDHYLYAGLGTTLTLNAAPR